MELLAVFTTVTDEKQAAAIATAAIEQKLAACVQVEPVRSTYCWEGSIEKNEPEVRLLFKTTNAKYQALEQLLLRLHPYKLPAIYALPVSEASAAYARWVCASVSPPQGDSDACRETS